MNSLPDWLVLWIDPRMKLLLDFFRDCRAIALKMLTETERDGKRYEEKEHATIFYEIIHSVEKKDRKKGAGLWRTWRCIWEALLSILKHYRFFSTDELNTCDSGFEGRRAWRWT